MKNMIAGLEGEIVSWETIELSCSQLKRKTFLGGESVGKHPGVPLLHCTMCCLYSTMAPYPKAEENTFSWETIIFEVIFPMFFMDENLKACCTFDFTAIETLLLEHSKLVKMTQKSQI